MAGNQDLIDYLERRRRQRIETAQSALRGMALTVICVPLAILVVRAFVNKCGEFQRRAMESEDVAKVIADASGELLELATVGQTEAAWKQLNAKRDVHSLAALIAAQE